MLPEGLYLLLSEGLYLSLPAELYLIMPESLYLLLPEGLYLLLPEGLCLLLTEGLYLLLPESSLQSCHSTLPTGGPRGRMVGAARRWNRRRPKDGLVLLQLRRDSGGAGGCLAAFPRLLLLATAAAPAFSSRLLGVAEECNSRTVTKVEYFK